MCPVHTVYTKSMTRYRLTNSSFERIELNVATVHMAIAAACERSTGEGPIALRSRVGSSPAYDLVGKAVDGRFWPNPIKAARARLQGGSR